MVLDKEQLSVLLLELEDGVLDRLHADLRNLRNELDFLKSEEAHRDMIKTVALRSPTLDAGTAGNEKSGLPELENIILENMREQKKILEKCIRNCMNKQLVIYQIFRSFLQFTEKDKKILRLTLRNSLESSVDILREEGMITSKRSLSKMKMTLLDQLLDKVNKEIAVIPEYDE